MTNNQDSKSEIVDNIDTPFIGASAPHPNYIPVAQVCDETSKISNAATAVNVYHIE